MLRTVYGVACAYATMSSTSQATLAALSALMRDVWTEGICEGAASETPPAPAARDRGTAWSSDEGSSDDGAVKASDEAARARSPRGVRASAAADAAERSAAAAAVDTSPNPRLPREADAVHLLQVLGIKEQMLQQMEAAVMRPVPGADSAGLSRRAAALVANARRREAVCALKLRGHPRKWFRFVAQVCL